MYEGHCGRYTYMRARTGCTARVVGDQTHTNVYKPCMYIHMYDVRHGAFTQSPSKSRAFLLLHADNLSLSLNH